MSDVDSEGSNSSSYIENSKKKISIVMVQNIEEVYTSKRAKKRPRQNSSKSKEK
jgi:hypothetical protein